jgi:pimeloyl-ACP methyl ester carboxylesterase
MELQPKLIDVQIPRKPEAAVLVLHGGASRRTDMMVSPTQLSVLRMIPIARAIAAIDRKRLAVFRLLNSRRGWDATTTPVHDARWALVEMAQRLGSTLPTALVGHSLGGRAALLTAGAPEVVSVVALAPWVYSDDSPRRLNGNERILVVHGDQDRVASPQRSQAVAHRIGARYVVVKGAKHAMLSHHREFSRLTRDWLAATLLAP